MSENKKILLPVAAIGLVATLVATQVAMPVSAYAAAQRGVFNYNVALVENRNSVVVVDPSIELSAEAQQLINEINAQLAQVRAQLDAGANLLKAEVDTAIARLNQVIDQLSLVANGTVDQAEVLLQQALTEVKDMLVNLVEQAVYAQEYNPGVYNQAYNEALTRAQQNQADWQAAVDAYEAPGGIVDQINAAVNNFNTLLSPALRSALALAGITLPNPITTDWVIGGGASVLNSISSSCGLISLPTLASACNGLMVPVNNITNNLSEYLAYKALLADPTVDPVTYATAAAEQADAAEQARARFIAQAAAAAAGLIFDQTITSIEALIAQAKTGVQTAITDFAEQVKAQLIEIKTEINAYLSDALTKMDALYQGLLNQKSGLTLVSTTKIGSSTGSNSRELTWRDILQGNFDIDAYEVQINLAEFPDCKTSEVPVKHKLTLESAWPTELNIDFNRSFTFPELKLRPINIDLSDLMNAIDLSQFGIQSSWLSNIINQRLNGQLTGLIPTIDWRNINVNINKTINLPDISGLLDWSKDTTKITRNSVSCMKAPVTGIGTATTTTSGSSVAATFNYSAVIIAAGIIGVGGAFFVRRQTTIRK